MAIMTIKKKKICGAVSTLDLILTNISQYYQDPV